MGWMALVEHGTCFGLWYRERICEDDVDADEVDVVVLCDFRRPDKLLILLPNGGRVEIPPELGETISTVAPCVGGVETDTSSF